MGRKTFVAVALLLGGVLVGSSWGTAAPAAADPAVLLQADEAFDAARAERGLEGFASFIAGDVTTIRPNQPIVRGKESFLAGWKEAYGVPGLSVRWKPEVARISDDGTLGFTLGSYHATQTDNGVTKSVGTGKYATIWRRQSDGSWKVVFDTGVKDAPPAAPAALSKP